jgi:hypothetical protein
VALVLRFELIVFGEDHNRFYQPHTVVWLFLLGWAIQQATTRRRRVLVSALVLAAVPGFFGQSVRETIIVGSLLALLWAPVVLVPRPLNRIVGVVAAASLYIYLTHWQAWPLLNEVLPLQLAVVGAVAAGVGAWYVLERVVPETLRHPALRRTTARSGGSTAIAWINGGRQEARP